MASLRAIRRSVTEHDWDSQRGAYRLMLQGGFSGHFLVETDFGLTPDEEQKGLAWGGEPSEATEKIFVEFNESGLEKAAAVGITEVKLRIY